MRNTFLVSYLLLFLLAGSGSDLMAQSNYLGIKTGINLATQRLSDETAKPNRITKLHVGLLYNLILSADVSVQAELQYSGEGFKPNRGFVDRIDYEYVALPIMFKYYILEKLNIHGGPQLSYLIDGTDGVVEESNRINLSVGAGAEYFIIERLGVSARYLLGFTDVDAIDDNMEATTNNIQLSLIGRL